jgi:hypothetical protein
VDYIAVLSAIGFSGATEMLIRDPNYSAKLLCQENTRKGLVSASTATEDIVQTLVDKLSRCKDRKEREEQIRMEEEWIENEVEERFREKWFENEVGKRVMSEMDRQFKYKREEKDQKSCAKRMGLP